MKHVPKNTYKVTGCKHCFLQCFWLERSLKCRLNLHPCFCVLDFNMVTEICVCLRQAATPPPPAAEPEVAFLVHDLYKIMVKCFHASFGFRIYSFISESLVLAQKDCLYQVCVPFRISYQNLETKHPKTAYVFEDPTHVTAKNKNIPMKIKVYKPKTFTFGPLNLEVLGANHGI